VVKTLGDMLLALDIGNTDMVFGVYENGALLHTWRTPTRSEHTAYHYQSYLKLQLLESGLSVGQFEKAVVSSVVPALTSVMVGLLDEFLGVKTVVVGIETCPMLRFEIDFPYELGGDLIANAVSAHSRFGKNCVIVDFGTALTFTALTRDGRVLGVAILPGLKTAVRSLFSHTAQLPEVPLTLPETAIGKNTVHAIQSGILFGYEGLVKSLLERFKSELGGEVVVIATGGLSSVIESLASEFSVIDPGLTLNGLWLIGESVRD
jgi:type III pantothenate kinase